MTEFTITIETNEGTITPESLDAAAEGFLKALSAGAAMSLRADTGVLHATFQVRAAFTR
jgi:hypothetical protein